MLQLAIALLVVWLIAFGIAMVIRSRMALRGQRHRPQNSISADGRVATVQGSVRRSTRRTLMALLNGDQKAAARLLDNIRFRYPGKSEEWYWEKVIYDLRRDRRV